MFALLNDDHDIARLRVWHDVSFALETQLLAVLHAALYQHLQHLSLRLLRIALPSLTVHDWPVRVHCHDVAGHR